MNQKTNLLRLASRWTLLSILILSPIAPLRARDLPPGKCQSRCQHVGYRPTVIIKLIVPLGGTPYASPTCACVKPGGTIIWRNSDPEVPWTVKFPNENPIDTPGNISDWDDTWFILDTANLQEYHYTAKIGGVDVDPHVVVGEHPPFMDANETPKAKKPQP